jgi:hypothetical protein
MNTKGLGKHYGHLTADERLSLLIHARDRGDEAELDQLLSSAPRITLCCGHQAPYVTAFYELAMGVLLELVDLAAEYFDSLERLADAEEMDAWDAKTARGARVAARGRKRRRGKRSSSERQRDLCRVHGFLLQANVAGWQLWCERRQLPPFWCWESLPGWNRVKRALDLLEDASDWPDGAPFTSEEFLCWLNRVRRGEPALTDDSYAPERLAVALADLFEELVRSGGGDDMRERHSDGEYNA